MLWHNWTSGLKVKLTFETAVFESYFRQEQRRQIRRAPLVEIDIAVLEKNFQIENSAFSFFYIPFMPEKFTGTRGAVGEKKITITSDVSSFFFLSTLNNLYCCDLDGNIAKILSKVGTVLKLDSDLSGTKTDFYIALKCFTSETVLEYQTDALCVSSINFQMVKE